MPFFLLAAALIVAWILALLAGGGFLLAAGAAGLGVSTFRSRAGRRVPRGLRAVSATGVILGALLVLVGVGAATYNLAAFLSTAT